MKMSKRKAPTSGDNKNTEFSEFLTELATFERDVSRNIHKYNAYRKAAGILAAHPVRIKSGDEARKLPGIGDKIGKKIQEFIDTGKLEKLEKIRADDTSVAIQLLTRITGIGPAKARELVTAGITSIEQLKEKQHLLNNHQKLGLRYFDDLEKRIPRDEITEAVKFIQKECKSVDEKYVATVCGSYRRGASNSGDIDVLLTHSDFVADEGEGGAKGPRKPKLLHKVVERLKSASFIKETISMGDSKFMGISRLNEDLPYRRLDVRLIPYNQYYCAILYFTGSDQFNRNMRQHALEKGFTLNEYSLRFLGVSGVPGEAMPISSEEDIFLSIDYPYKKPEDRNM